MEKIMEINCSNKETWANLINGEKLPNNIKINLDDKDQMTNLIYLLPIIDKCGSDMPLIILSGEIDYLYEADAFLYLCDRRRIAFPAKPTKTAKGYVARKNMNFDSSMPFLKFQINNLKDLNSIFDLTLDKNASFLEVLDFKKLKGEGHVIEFIKLYIQNKLLEWAEKNKKKYKILEKSSKEMNLLALFLFTYQIKDLGENIQEFQLNDLKQVIKQLAVGIYEIIENSCIHSLGKTSYFSLSNINFNLGYQKKITTFIEANENKLNKKSSFLKNYNFQLDDKQYIFIRLIDSIKNKSEEISLIQNLKNKNLIENDYTLRDFFSKLYIDEDTYKEKSVSNEYGLITFLSSAETLSMQFLSNSGSDAFLFTNHLNLSYQFINEIKCPINKTVTEYSCIIPIEPLNKSNKSISTVSTDLNFLDKPNFDMISIDLKETEVKDYYDGKDDKNKIIKSIYTKWEKAFYNPEIQICRINIELDQIEFLVKILSKQIERALNNNFPTYIILNFIEKDRGALTYKISKFFQYYKVAIKKLLVKFSDNIVSKNSLDKIDHNKFQFAFYHTKDRKMNYISTMVGINWDCIVLSFINNLLYNNELSLENYFDLYLDQIKFNSNKLPEKIDVLPFEFYIRGSSGRNQFLETLENFCKDRTVMHEEVNVLLRSGLYLKNFYAAEHLFMNRYCVKKIALLIKQDFDKHIKAGMNKEIKLVSYGNYSHFLCEELATLLECTKLIVPHTNLLELQISENPSSEDYNQFEFIGLLPIGSTLFSYYRMNAYLRKYFKIPQKKLLLKNNYSVLVVAPEKNDFWKITELEDDSNESFNVLEMNDEKDLKVRFMIRLDPDWKTNVGDTLAVTHVDKTSTIPNSICQNNNVNLENKEIIKDEKKEKAVKKKEEQRKQKLTKFKLLKDAVEYGHFSLNHNHYLFYINPKKIFKDTSKESNLILEKELEEINEKIDPLAYNIIISPLNDTNNAFLEAVIKYVFANKVSILQFDLYNTYRDNFINKNLNILKNIDKILKVSSTTKVNIYFVDNTIISAQTIKRAKELMHALLRKIENSLVFDRFPKRIFEKAFILINRCSNNTLETIMDHQENVYSFINIKCPHFDTVGDCCPDCNISNNYQVLADFTSDESLRKKLLDISHNHKIKKITPNYIINPTDQALARLCFTDFILSEIKNIIWKKEDYVNIISNLYENAKAFVSQIVTLDEMVYKMLFVKTISRPLISTYEFMKQAGFVYLKRELENELNNTFEDTILSDYCHTLIQRISYYGTSYLRNNVVSFKSRLKNKTLERALLWEEAYARGVIK